MFLYALSSVLQAAGARDSDQPETLGALRALVRSPAWLSGLVCLVIAFLCFAISTQLLSLPMAEAVRSTYVVLAVVLGHLVFRTHPSGRELVGVVVAVTALVVFVTASGGRGSEQPTAALGWTMLIVLVVVALAALATRRAELMGSASRLVGFSFAVLAGISFGLLAVGVRSLTSLTDVTAMITTGTAWLGGLAALAGLVLFAGSAAATTLAVATTVMVVVEAVVSSVVAVVAFGDAAGTAPVVWVVSGLGIFVGALLVASSADSKPVHLDQPGGTGSVSSG